MNTTTSPRGLNRKFFLVCTQTSHSMDSSKTRRWVILKYSMLFLNFLNFFNVFHDYWFHFTTNTIEWKHDSYDDVLMQFRWSDDLSRSNYFPIPFRCPRDEKCLVIYGVCLFLWITQILRRLCSTKTIIILVRDDEFEQWWRFYDDACWRFR